MKRFVREPLLHFVLLGAAFFALQAMVRDRRVEAGGGEILVTAGRVENLAALFQKTWQRTPTVDDLRGLVRDHVLEEALYREGLALGLDRDDVVIRRRLRQKMEFVVDDIAEVAEPGDADLEAWLAEHPESYAEPTRFSFRQVFLSPDVHGDSARAEAELLLAELQAQRVEDPGRAGDATLLAYANANMGAEEVEQVFGPAFAGRLQELPPGQWSDPIESAYGLHLVFLDERSAGRAPTLVEVRRAVERDWRVAQRERAKELFDQELLERYRVTIEWPRELAETGFEEAP